MAYELLLQSLAQHITLSPEEEQLIVLALQQKKIRRKQFLFQEGEVHRYQTFVLKGCLRMYSVDKNGFEHILQFAPPGWWVADMHSVQTQTPGTFYIDAILDSEIIIVQRSDIETLYQTIPKLERYFRILAENALVTYQHRLVDNLSLSARERYEGFCKRYPSLITTLPQKQVAAYIGVTPEFLSKMLNTVPARKPGKLNLD